MFYLKQILYSVFHKKSLLRAWLLLASMWIALPSYAANDLLELPAKLSEKAASSMLLDIVNTGTRLVAVGEWGHILYSDDNGHHWDQASVPTSLTLTAVHFATPLKGWAVGHDGIVLHTNDGGKTWLKQLDGFKGNELNLAHTKTLVADKEAELSGAPEADRDGLATELDDLQYELENLESAVKDRICCEPLMDVWFKNDREGFVIGAYGQFYHTTDGGESWTPWWDRIDNPDGFHLNAIAQAKGALFIAGEAGTLYRSTDGGEHFTALESPYEGSFFGVVASPDQSYVFAFGLGGNAAYSNDLGQTWKHIQTKAGAALAGGVVRSDGSVLLVSYSGVLLSGSGKTGTFTTRRIGKGWTGVTEAGNGQVVLVGIGGVHRPEIKSADFGG